MACPQAKPAEDLNDGEIRWYVHYDKDEGLYLHHEHLAFIDLGNHWSDGAEAYH